MEKSKRIAGIYSINAAALLLGAAHFLSRVLGVIRDRMLAGHFGAGRELDIYYAAFQIPDFMSTLFLLGAGANAILPVFQEYFSRDEDEAKRLISDVVTVFCIGSILAAAIVAIAAPLLVPVLTPGFMPSEHALTTMLIRIMLLSPILLGLSSILSSVVQSFHKFFTYALAPILYNLGIIFGIAAFLPRYGVRGLAFGVVLGALLHAGIQWISLHRSGFTPKLVWPRLSKGMRRIWRLSIPRVIAVSLTQLTVVVLVALGSTLASGSIAVFQLAQNLYFFPIGIFGASFATAVFPRLHRAFLDRSPEDFFTTLTASIRSILFWLAPSAVLFIVLRAHIVRVAFGTGAFSWTDTRLTAATLAVLALVLAAGGLSALLIKGFYALGNTALPLVINAGTAVLSVGAAFGAMKLFTVSPAFTRLVGVVFRISDMPRIEVVGLALGSACGILFDTWMLYAALKGLAKRIFGEAWVLPVRDVLVIFGAALAGGAAAYAVRGSLSEALLLSTFTRVLFEGIAVGIVGFSVYCGILFLAGNAEIRALWATLRRHLWRISVLPASWNGESASPER